MQRLPKVVKYMSKLKSDSDDGILVCTNHPKSGYKIFISNGCILCYCCKCLKLREFMGEPHLSIDYISKDRDLIEIGGVKL